jgi:predicted site-specific integrase-resolvase
MVTLANWASSRAAADALAVSERTLHRWRASGLLKAGIHWRRKFPTANSPLLYDLGAVEDVMREATARSPQFLELTS